MPNPKEDPRKKDRGSNVVVSPVASRVGEKDPRQSQRTRQQSTQVNELSQETTPSRKNAASNSEKQASTTDIDGQAYRGANLGSSPYRQNPLPKHTDVHDLFCKSILRCFLQSLRINIPD